MGPIREEDSFFGSFTSSTSGILGGMHGGSRFLSSRLEFLSLIGGGDGVSLVKLRLFLSFGSLAGGLDDPRRCVLDNRIYTYDRQLEAGGFWTGAKSATRKFCGADCTIGSGSCYAFCASCEITSSSIGQDDARVTLDCSLVLEIEMTMAFISSDLQKLVHSYSLLQVK